MSEEQNRFSLRKLSIGLASVLVGVSIFGTSQTVKADTVANNQTSSVTSNAQSSDTQENENAAKSSFSSDNQVDNAKSNLIQTQGNNLQQNKAENVQQNPTSSQEANSSNDLQQKDVERDIVRTSSLQESNNQSNQTTETTVQHDTLESGQKVQSFNLPKNSQSLNEKELATNLTQDNSTQDISKVSDPSKIDASHFADGTRWTPAGWTRTDKNTKTAKSSDFSIYFYASKNIDKNTGTYKEAQGDPIWIHPNKLTFTVDKNDMANGGRILVGTIQFTPTQGKQSLVSGKHTTWGPDMFGGSVTSSTYQIVDQNGKQIGYLTNEEHDVGEIDTWFNLASPVKNLATDPTFTFIWPNRNFVVDLENNDIGNYADYYSAKNGWQYPLRNSIVTNASVLNYQTDFDLNKIKPISGFDSHQWNIYPDNTWIQIEQDITNLRNQSNPVNNPTSDNFVFKIQSLRGDKPTFFNYHMSNYIHIYDASGNMTTESQQFKNYNVAGIKKADNLSALDLYNATSDGQLTYSKQTDGSFLICTKSHPDVPSKTEIEDAVNLSYLANIQDSKHYNQILANTLKNTQSWASASRRIYLPNISNVNTVLNVTDVTPNTIHSNHLGTFKIISIITGTGGTKGQGDVETFKSVKISYIDDDNSGSNVSLDSMIGRQNIASTYTVNIPHGYYLDDNNNATGYTWNADHTQITYTFNTDQAKNDANPITIHLKHIHSAVTDPSQIQSTAKRTIVFHMPDNITQTIVQTIGLKRTGDLDEATNTATYTDWTVDNTHTNVTVNGVKNASMSAYKMNGKKIMFCGFPIPHINGYKATVTRSTNKVNPAVAMFTVSFIAVPTENKPSTPVEVAPSKPSANADNPNHSAWTNLDHKVMDGLNADDSGWTMPENTSTYTVEVPADDAIIDLSDLVIAEPVHAQITTQIRVTKRFKLRKHGKKHVAKHLKHRKKAVKSFKKYRL